jgi:hypothetical protein
MEISPFAPIPDPGIESQISERRQILVSAHHLVDSVLIEQEDRFGDYEVASAVYGLGIAVSRRKFQNNMRMIITVASDITTFDVRTDRPVSSGVAELHEMYSVSVDDAHYTATVQDFEGVFSKYEPLGEPREAHRDQPYTHLLRTLQKIEGQQGTQPSRREARRRRKEASQTSAL